MRSPAAVVAETPLANEGNGMAAVQLREWLLARDRRTAEIGHCHCRALQQRRGGHAPYLVMRARRGNGQQHVEQRLACDRVRALERQQMALGDGATERGILVGVMAHLKDAVARHDDHEWIFGERLCYGKFTPGTAHLARDLAIGAGFAARDGADELVDPLAKDGLAGHVEADLGEIACAAARLHDNAFNGHFDVQRGALLARLRIEAKKPPARLQLTRLRQLHGNNAGAAPYDATTADAGVKDRVTTPHNATPAQNHHNTVMKARTWNLGDRLRGGRPKGRAKCLADRPVSAKQGERQAALRGRSSMAERQLPNLKVPFLPRRQKPPENR